MVGDHESAAVWPLFLRWLPERGLSGVRLVISDSHGGLVKATRKVVLGAAWQRCRVHFVRNVCAVIMKGSAEMLAATIRTVFAQPTAEAIRDQLDTVADRGGVTRAVAESAMKADHASGARKISRHAGEAISVPAG